MTIVEQYTKELHQKFGYYATWLPGKKLSVGDVGKLNGNVFEYETNLKKLGIPFNILKDKSKIDLDYASKGSVSIEPKIAGKAASPGSNLQLAEAGISIKFGKEKSIVFKAKGVLNHQIEDLVPIKAEVLKRYKEEAWEKSWVIITEICVADSATILISNKKETTVDIQAKADIQAKDLNLANAEAGFHLLNSSGLETSIVAQSQLMPLFKVVGIKTSLFSSPEIATRGDEDTEFGVEEIYPEG